jgi:hypothetical protein
MTFGFSAARNQFECAPHDWRGFNGGSSVFLQRVLVFSLLMRISTACALELAHDPGKARSAPGPVSLKLKGKVLREDHAQTASQSAMTIRPEVIAL